MTCSAAKQRAGAAKRCLETTNNEHSVLQMMKNDLQHSEQRGRAAAARRHAAMKNDEQQCLKDNEEQR